MNKTVFDFTDRPQPKADHDDDPNFYRVEPGGLAWCGFVIVKANGDKLDPQLVYPTEDEAENAIGEMVSADEKDRKYCRGRHERLYYERLAEEEGPSRGPRFGASYGANSAGRR